MRILIVGAGPSGLTAAVELVRGGMIANMIDCKPAASTLSRAVGILPRSLKLLAPAGVTDRLLEEGVKIREILVFSLLGGLMRRGQLLASRSPTNVWRVWRTKHRAKPTQ